MKDLNDLYIFSQVVEHNGFTGAARALGVARSSVCRRVAHLEKQLGVRLVQRSTRQFAVTDLGMEFNTYCLKMVAEAQAAYDRIACVRAKPAGMIRMSCPAVMSQLLLSPLLPLFIEKNPEVRIAIEATNRKVAIDENFDLSIRLQQLPAESSQIVMRSLGIVQQVVVASRGFLERHGTPVSPAQASHLPTLSYGCLQGPHVWRLIDPDEREIQIRHAPKLIADDMIVVRQAAVQGLGIVQLPLVACIDEIRRGLLEVILPEFLAPPCEIHVLFPSRRGMLPAVRSFIDFLSAHCTREAEGWHIQACPGRRTRDVRFWAKRNALEQSQSKADGCSQAAVL